MQLTKFLYPTKLAAIQEASSVPTLNRLCNCMQSAIFQNRNTCLLSRADLRKDISYVSHLFACDIEIVDSTLIYFLTHNTDIDSTSTLSVTLLICTDNGSFRKIKLLSERKDNLINTESLLEVNPDTGDSLENLNNRFSEKIKEGKWQLR